MILVISMVGVCGTAIGVAVGKLWGSHGKQSILVCDTARMACKETFGVKLDYIIERLSRIESQTNKRDL